eukprot:1526085-Rhodomonas_salina.1
MANPNEDDLLAARLGCGGMYSADASAVQVEAVARGLRVEVSVQEERSTSTSSTSTSTCQLDPQLPFRGRKLEPSSNGDGPRTVLQSSPPHLF